MRAVVVYESMYGNTHQVAETIANGLAGTGETEVLSLEDATADVLRTADLVVVGGPTHVHGMSRPSTRKAAMQAVEKQPELELDPDAPGVGLREWLAALPQYSTKAAAFDTRIDAPAFLTGRASKGIARRLRKHGFELIVEPESFLVTKDNVLVEGEADHARRWAETLASHVSTPVPRTR
jgi:hypothetical protein